MSFPYILLYNSINSKFFTNNVLFKYNSYKKYFSIFFWYFFLNIFTNVNNNILTKITDKLILEKY